MAEHHELLEHSENGNYYPHGKFISREEAHKHAKSLGLKSHEYSIKEHQSHHWGNGKGNQHGDIE